MSVSENTPNEPKGHHHDQIDMAYHPGMLPKCWTSLGSPTRQPLTISVIVGSPKDSEIGDSSGPLYSLYSEVVGGGDNKEVERLQKDAKGIVLFVSPHHCSHTPGHIN
jgi:hypothetical protein